MRRCNALVTLALALSMGSTAFAQARWSVDPKPSVSIRGYTAAGDPVLALPSGATRLPSGTIVVADGTAPAVRFFAPNGRLINSVGRAGSGPGEYTTISWLGRCGEDSLFVYDLYKRRLSVLDTSGRFVRQFQAPGDASLLACSRGGTLGILGGANPAGLKPGSDRRVKARVTLATSEGVITATIPDVPFYELASTGGTPLPNPLGPLTALALSRDRLFLGTADSAAVDIYTQEGRRVGQAILPGSNRRPTPAHQAAAIEDFLRFTTNVAMRKAMRDQLAKIPAPDRLPPYSALLTDRDGLLWVHRSIQGDPRSRLTAVRGDGRVVAEVELPVYLKIFEIGSDYILGARESEDGEPQVLMYRLRRGW